jgi:hypothetical protein
MKTAGEILEWIDWVCEQSHKHPYMFAIGAAPLEGVLLTLDSLRRFIVENNPENDDRSYRAFCWSRGIRTQTFCRHFEQSKVLDTGGPPSPAETMEAFCDFWVEFLAWRDSEGETADG